MKVYLIIIALFMATPLLAVFAAGSSNNSQSPVIVVSDTREAYVFSAKYDPPKTVSVERFINREISPDRMGSSKGDYIDAWTTLIDHTGFTSKNQQEAWKYRLKKLETLRHRSRG